jgi:hypothetical protein
MSLRPVLKDNSTESIQPALLSGTQWRLAFTPGVYETRYMYLYPGHIDLDKRGAMYNFAWGSGECVGKSARDTVLGGDDPVRSALPAGAPQAKYNEVNTCPRARQVNRSFLRRRGLIFVIGSFLMRR